MLQFHVKRSGLRVAFCFHASAEETRAGFDHPLIALASIKIRHALLVIHVRPDPALPLGATLKQLERQNR